MHFSFHICTLDFIQQLHNTNVQDNWPKFYLFEARGWGLSMEQKLSQYPLTPNKSQTCSPHIDIIEPVFLMVPGVHPFIYIHEVQTSEINSSFCKRTDSNCQIHHDSVFCTQTVLAPESVLYNKLSQF